MTAEFAAGLIRSSVRPLASAIAVRLEDEVPEILRALPESFADARDDVLVRLQHLAAALEFDRPELIEHAVRWYAIALHHRGVPSDYLAATLGVTRGVIQDELPADAVPFVLRHLDAAERPLASGDFEVASHLDLEQPHGRTAANFLLATLEGRGDDAAALVRQELDAGLSVADLHDHVLVPVQRETGRMWLMGEIHVADEHFSSQVVDRVLWVAQDRIPPVPVDAPAVLAMGVAGDTHGFGLRMIAQRLQADGLRVHNLGPDMPASDLSYSLHERFDLVAISATMALHLNAMRRAVAQVRRLLGGVPILLGGRPFEIAPGLHEAFGAEAAATDGTSASAAAKRLIRR
ncbi:MAG: cobalamin-dependent protein [bacterium]|nr:cobalamin-dependent protein [bacterium]